ncbi:MAG: glycosyltransferase family 4 protein [Candidatus Moranbacteria bacterium]|nr:glycosyltransferase family 4 protein [Candidatus Moranbacteria bacterium]
MTTALQVADLDASRIDGTRIYILELLKRFGTLAPNEAFHLYHKHAFNPELAPPLFENYTIHPIPFPNQWMQTRFALEMYHSLPERIFFPVQAVPVFLPKASRVTVTVHDLAFRKYPETFTPVTQFKLNFLLDRAISRAQNIIAVSEATKRDLLASFPELSENQVHVIHHGFNRERFGTQIPTDAKKILLNTYGLSDQGYILYVGALQPRKNLVRLIEAFAILKQHAPEAKLVLAGEPAWLSREIFTAHELSPYRGDIFILGQVPSHHLPTLYQGARCLAFPSLYEGFGLPILEAFASGTPVLTAHNSSLPEVAGDAALFTDAFDSHMLAAQLLRLWQDDHLRETLVTKGTERLKAFSWDICAQKTLSLILGTQNLKTTASVHATEPAQAAV